MSLSETPYIAWLFILLAASAVISPLALREQFRKNDLKKLFTNGITGSAKIVGYDIRSVESKMDCIVIFEFSPNGTPEPASYYKKIWSKMRPSPGSIVSVHYNATFPMLLALDDFGLLQAMESYPEPPADKK
jgi:hypothetical protein